MPVIGYLNLASPETNASNRAAFLQGLKETGHVEGRNLEIEDRFADFSAIFQYRYTQDGTINATGSDLRWEHGS